MKKAISKIIVLSMLLTLAVFPQTASAASVVTIDSTLTAFGFNKYNGSADFKADCTVVDSGDSSYGNVLQIYAHDNPSRSNRYGGIIYEISVTPGDYRLECDYRNVEVTAATDTDTTECQLFTSFNSEIHGGIFDDYSTRLESDFVWHHKNFKVTVGEAGTYKVCFGVSGNFKAWIDNVKIYRTDAPSVNLLPTSDFSTYTNVPRGFKDIVIRKEDMVAKYELVDSDHGTKCLKVSQLKTGLSTDPFAGIRFIIPPEKLVESHTYYFEFYWKKENLDSCTEYTKVLAAVGNSRGTRTEVNASKSSVTSEWKQWNKNANCTNVNDFGIDIIQMRHSAMYLDDIQCYDLTSDPGKTVNLIPHGDFEPYIEVEKVTFDENGKATAYITNQAGTSRQAIMLAGAYDASENLVQATFGTQKTYNAQGANDAAYTAELTLPTASASSVKVFVWDNLIDCNAIGRSTLKP